MTLPNPKRIVEAALSLRGRRVVVAGLGLFGGGAAAARYLAREGADVLVTDLKSEAALADSVKSLAGVDVTLKLGTHDRDDFESADLVVANPAIPFRSEYLQAAIAAGVPVTSEIGLFAARFRGRTVAVTGTSGKTTTTMLIGRMVANAIPDTLVGGNMGVSLLDNVAETTEHSTAVLELSSFQLRYLGMMAWRPDIAVVTNFAPNHLDVHDGVEDYRSCKRMILAHQGTRDRAVLNAEDPEVGGWAATTDARVGWFGTERREEDGVFVDGNALVWVRGGRARTICGTQDVRIPGRHNLANACAAACAALDAGVDPVLVAEVLGAFEGVEHRLEHCGVVDEVAWYNDSVATSPERTMVALEALHGPIVLIAGGSDKGLDYVEMGRAVDVRVKRVVLIGETAEAIGRAIRAAPVDSAASLEEAVERAKEAAVPGDAVLLSPASASYDMFANFTERGRAFKAAVGKLADRRR